MPVAELILRPSRRFARWTEFSFESLVQLHHLDEMPQSPLSLPQHVHRHPDLCWADRVFRSGEMARAAKLDGAAAKAVELAGVLIAEPMTIPGVVTFPQSNDPDDNLVGLVASQRPGINR